MDIYDDEGDLDFGKARQSLEATPAINAADVRRARYAELQIAATLDIAASLRVLALEALLAMPGGEEPDVDTEPVTEETRDFLVEGDLVTVVGDTAPGEVVKLGWDQGEIFADVAFAEGRRERFYVRNLERLVGDRARLNPEAGLGLVGSVSVETVAESLRDLAESDVPLVGVATEAETPALLTDADEDGEEAVGGYELDEATDDIDADFDASVSPAAEDALERLKANEAARKSAKKKGSKK